MLKYKKLLLLFVIFTVCISLFLNQNKSLTYSFYHWKNSYELQSSSEKLYIKVLDIAYSNKLETIVTKFNTPPQKGFVPVVYITNKAMKESSLSSLVQYVSKELKLIPYVYEEIQIDCDWSLSTKSKYFDFLEQIKKNSD